jgi:predicted CoA-binding protein
MSNEELRKIFEETQAFAVVGLSSKEDRESNVVCSFLQSKGYRIIPVNPNEDEVLGEKAYPDLKSVPEKFEVVLVFRRPSEVSEVARQALETGAETFWMQQGAGSIEAAEIVMNAGMKVVINDCAMRQYCRLDVQEPIKK